MVSLGLKTPIESPDPCRSDCHAWSSHPAFHFRATVAGIRPITPGFRRILVQPQPGRLRTVRTGIPHPRGRVEADFEFDGENLVRGTIRLPRLSEGEFVWRGRRQPLRPGVNRIA